MSDRQTVLFLCTGNYYRSRFAELLFNRLAEQEQLPWRADSRGLRLSDANPGPLSIHARTVLAKLEVPLPQPVRFPIALTEADLRAAAHVVAVKEHEHRPLLAEQFPDWTDRVEFWHVHDLDCAAPEHALPELAQHVRDLLQRVHCRLLP
ncbi:MAG: hypothetical protein RIC55_10215 [Pirellulaceae bacterium]